MAEAYQRNLDKFREAMRKEFPDPLIVIGVDYGSEPATTVVHHKCARCEQVLPVMRCGLSEAAAQANLDAALAAHQERCFRPGDHVRWEWKKHGRWAEGDFVGALKCDGWTRYTMIVAGASVGNWSALSPSLPIGKEHQFGVRVDGTGQDIRRIPRPEQKVEFGTYQEGFDRQAEQPTLSARLGHLKHGPGGSGPSGPCDADCRKCAAERKPQEFHAVDCPYYDSVDAECICNGPPPTIETPWITPGGPRPDPLDTKYDGQTLRDLLAADLAMSRETLISDMPLWFRIQDGLTRTQRQAVSAYRSAELRAKIAASREAERCAVRVDDDLWLANCKDVDEDL
jgi:hypothetical protein